MVFSLILIGAGIIGLSVLLYRFAVYALPAAIGIQIGFWMYQHGAGVIGAFFIGLLAGGAVFALAQVLLADARPAPLRFLILLIFMLPAAYAGYSMVLQLAELGSLSYFWRELYAIVGAIVVGWSAGARLMAPSSMLRHRHELAT